MKKIRRFFSRTALLSVACLGLLFFHRAFALSAPPHEEAGTAPIVVPAEDSPRMVLQRFMEFAKAGNFEMAATFLDHHLPRRQAVALAEKLYILIDQQGWIAMQKISVLSEGDLTDHKDVNVEVIGTIRLQSTPEPILLRRMHKDFEEGMTWKFDYEFLLKIPSLYEAISVQSLERFFPQWSRDTELWGVRLWQWFTVICALLASLLSSLVISRITIFFLLRVNRRSRERFDESIIRESVRPVIYLLVIGFFHFITLFLEIPFAARNVIYSVETFLALLILTSLGLKATNLFIRHLHNLAEKNHRSNAVAMLPSARKALKLVIIGIAITYFLTQIGVNITAIVAGLGIGGIAIALAGQKTIENLIGGISLIADQPVRVGDYCRFGDNKEGKVEDIGLRSTRIRTLERTVVAIPNAEFAQTQIENFGKRDMIRFLQVISVRYDTTPDQMRYLLLRLKEILTEHEMIDTDPVRVRFIKFGLNGLEIELCAYVHTAENEIFLAVKEDINLRILEVIAECGSYFSFPTSTINWERPAPRDPQKILEISRKLKELQERSE